MTQSVSVLDRIQVAPSEHTHRETVEIKFCVMDCMFIGRSVGDFCTFSRCKGTYLVSQKFDSSMGDSDLCLIPIIPPSLSIMDKERGIKNKGIQVNWACSVATSHLELLPLGSTYATFIISDPIEFESPILYFQCLGNRAH